MLLLGLQILKSQNRRQDCGHLWALSKRPDKHPNTYIHTWTPTGTLGHSYKVRDCQGFMAKIPHMSLTLNSGHDIPLHLLARMVCFSLLFAENLLRIIMMKSREAQPSQPRKEQATIASSCCGTFQGPSHSRERSEYAHVVEDPKQRSLKPHPILSTFISKVCHDMHYASSCSHLTILHEEIYLATLRTAYHVLSLIRPRIHAITAPPES